MPFIYDNLIASVISMTVFLILVSIQADATQGNTARTSRNVAKGQAQSFITWLEEDLAKMGKNMNAGAAAYESPEDSTQWHTETFEFSFLNSSGDTVRTKYDLRQVGTRTVDGESEKIFRVKRSRKVGGGSWVSRGESPASLEYFKVEMLDEDADPAGSPSDVQFIKVRFAVAAPFQSESTLLRRVHRSAVVPYRLAGR
jgi:hypothetical protein